MSVTEIFIGLVSTVGTDKDIVIKDLTGILALYNYISYLEFEQNAVMTFEEETRALRTEEK